MPTPAFGAMMQGGRIAAGEGMAPDFEFPYGFKNI